MEKIFATLIETGEKVIILGAQTSNIYNSSSTVTRVTYLNEKGHISHVCVETYDPKFKFDKDILKILFSK